jgi:hypothetical protein
LIFFADTLETHPTAGGMSLYITGVTIRDSSVELINPPISTIASGAINGLVDSAIGIT